MDAGPHELLHLYERHLRSFCREDTVDHRMWMAERVLQQWPDPATVTLDDLAHLVGTPDAGWSRRTYYNHLRSFFGWLAEAGRIADDPTVGLHAPKQPKTRPKPLTNGEQERALAAAHGDTQTWLMLALFAGLRAHEIAKVRGEDVQEDFIYVSGKGETGAHIPTQAEIWEIAQEYPRQGWWFPSPAHGGHIAGETVTRTTARLFRRVGITSGSIHRARHSYATSLLRKGVHIRTVQRLMRHESLATTAAYTAVDEDELRAAINLLGRSA